MAIFPARPLDASTFGLRADGLFHFTTVCACVFLLASLVVVGWALVRRPAKSRFARGDSRRAILSTLGIVVVAFVGLDGVLLARSYADLADGYWAFPQTNVLRVEVLAQQWGWNIRLAG